MDVKLEKWFRPNIDKEVLRELTKKSDIKGLIHVSIYFSLLSIVGYLAYLTCLLYTSPSPRDRTRSRMPSSA